MSSQSIAIRRLSFSYGRRQPVFNDLNLNIAPGSIYGLLGPNGCGKSTLFRLLLGQSLPSADQLSVLGLAPGTDYVDLRCRVGFVPQENDLPPRCSVDEVLSMFQQLYSDRWNQELADRLLQRLELQYLRDRTIESLSGGLKQRLSLLTAVAIEPDILLLDEPTTGLDAVNRRQFTETVIEFMAKDPERTVLISSHLLSEIEPLVDHVGILAPHPEGSRMLVECSLSDLKRNIRIVELDDAQIPSVLRDQPSLLSISQGTPSTLVFWVDSSEQDQRLAQAVEQSGAKPVDQASLNDIFVRFFRGKHIEFRARA